jgi:hypothetical protein
VKNRTRIAKPKIKSVRSISSIVADLSSLPLDGFQLELEKSSETPSAFSFNRRKAERRIKPLNGLINAQ